MLRNQKGAALLQVLLVTVVLAGMATMLLRSSLSRTTTARQTRRTVASQLLIDSCQAEVNALWSMKSPETFSRDLRECWMYCKVPAFCPTLNDMNCRNQARVPCDDTGDNPNASREYRCAPVEAGGAYYQVTATFQIPAERQGSGDDGDAEDVDNEGQCPLVYSIVDGTMSGTVFVPSADGDVAL